MRMHFKYAFGDEIFSSWKAHLFKNQVSYFILGIFDLISKATLDVFYVLCSDKNPFDLFWNFSPIEPDFCIIYQYVNKEGSRVYGK
ncbi:MAG TPA: hypothetical protein OIL76_09870 [Veillonellaceae bacterium]|nr:hypothetical protein [Veillonellaceae bacterium]